MSDAELAKEQLCGGGRSPSREETIRTGTPPREIAPVHDDRGARIAAWTRRVGDPVARGDAIAEIETAKTTVEMEALATGTLVEIVQQAGAEVLVGTVIGYVEDGS